jgi:ribosomal 50S subunit-recycling heat shock protein
MRLDVFLKLVGAAKTRNQAARMVSDGRVKKGVPDTRPLKPSHEVVAGQAYRIERPAGGELLTVLAVPPGKSLAKKDRSLYVGVEKLPGTF